ncbi:MAG TPA: hypothetical protein VFF52_28440 [Isosphaeraceae bacterium]|nr:hypothetical protein [Isosphaeraceae bacterium]
MNKSDRHRVFGDPSGATIRLVRARSGNWVGVRWRRRWGRAASLLVLAFVSGCFSPPRRAAEMMGTPPTATVPPGAPAQVGEAGLPADCWKRSGDLEPRVALSQGRRVVVTEFDVEFVDYQFQLPIPRQPMVKGPMISINPVHMAINAIGIGRRSSRMEEEEQRALASKLYTTFLEDLRRRGLGLVSQDELHASPGYAELRKRSVVGSSPLLFLNMLGSDTGTVLHTRTVAAPGLCVLEGSLRGALGQPGFLDDRAFGQRVLRGSVHARTAAEAQILQETRADLALAVRLRVGTFRGQPALEHRSMIRLTTCEGSTTLRACHSLVSDLVVTDPPRFRPVVGRIEPVDSGMFSSELTAMLPNFIALALSETRP